MTLVSRRRSLRWRSPKRLTQATFGGEMKGVLFLLRLMIRQTISYKTWCALSFAGFHIPDFELAFNSRSIVKYLREEEYLGGSSLPPSLRMADRTTPKHLRGRRLRPTPHNLLKRFVRCWMMRLGGLRSPPPPPPHTSKIPSRYARVHGGTLGSAGGGHSPSTQANLLTQSVSEKRQRLTNRLKIGTQRPLVQAVAGRLRDLCGRCPTLAFHRHCRNSQL